VTTAGPRDILSGLILDTTKKTAIPASTTPARNKGVNYNKAAAEQAEARTAACFAANLR
jgi:hypothetical protein